MSTNNIGFYEEMAKIIFQLSSNIHFICSSESVSKLTSGSFCDNIPPQKRMYNLTESVQQDKFKNAYEPRHEKTKRFAYAKTKMQISFAVTAKLISTFVFATWMVQSLYFLNPNFQASSHLL